MRAWRAISLPLSQVRVRANQAGEADGGSSTAAGAAGGRGADAGGGDGGGAVPVGQGQEGEVAGHPLDDGGDGGVGRGGAHDQVALVVAGPQAAPGLGGPLPDRAGAEDLPAPVPAGAPA